MNKIKVYWLRQYGQVFLHCILKLITYLDNMNSPLPGGFAVSMDISGFHIAMSYSKIFVAWSDGGKLYFVQEYLRYECKRRS